MKKIDKSFGWFPYSGFGKLSREMREQLHSWLQQKKDQQKFEDDSSEEESKKTPADCSDEEGIYPPTGGGIYPPSAVSAALAQSSIEIRPPPSGAMHTRQESAKLSSTARLVPWSLVSPRSHPL